MWTSGKFYGFRLGVCRWWLRVDALLSPLGGAKDSRVIAIGHAGVSTGDPVKGPVRTGLFGGNAL